MQEEINNCLAVLKRGGLILYPTDTVWGIGCDATHPEAIDKIYALKHRAESKSLICLVNDFKMINQLSVTAVSPVATKCVPASCAQIMDQINRASQALGASQQKI